MSAIKTFQCPGCGSPLKPTGKEKMVKCGYCGNTIIVPEELRGQGPNAQEELTPEQALFSPQHVEWLVKNGVDATVKIEFLKERDRPINNCPVFDLHLVGLKTNGEKFENAATINVPRNLVPLKGSAIKIKYNANKIDILEVEDFVLQIGGQYVYCFPNDNSFLDL
jgi:DNA-directed RNA polymerase subunit RPC12/RpoP